MHAAAAQVVRGPPRLALPHLSGAKAPRPNCQASAPAAKLLQHVKFRVGVCQLTQSRPSHRCRGGPPICGSAPPPRLRGRAPRCAAPAWRPSCTTLAPAQSADHSAVIKARCGAPRRQLRAQLPPRPAAVASSGAAAGGHGEAESSSASAAGAAASSGGSPRKVRRRRRLLAETWTQPSSACMLAATEDCLIPRRRAARGLQQAGCPDLVAGGAEAEAEVAAGGTSTVLAFEHVGPIYLVGAAQVGMGPCTWFLAGAWGL